MEKWKTLNNHNRIYINTEQEKMIIIISAKEQTPQGAVDHRFGRSRWLAVYDTERKTWETALNPGNEQSGGAGVAAVQFVIDRHADVVISGDFGPHAADAFRTAKVEMCVFSQDVITVEDTIERYLQHKLSVVQ
jgi:predicted Fe-Mo cluster-binding NifX family protein